MFTKYHEKGQVVIPIIPRSKRPVSEAANFDQWSIHGQSEETIEMFNDKFPPSKGFGLAAVMGFHSDLMCVDIDTLIPEIINSVPLSPVLRLGQPSRYGALFFRRGDDIKGNFSFKRTMKDGTKEGVDILVDRKYIVLPPSIHPITLKPYTWALEPLDETENNELPILTMDHIRAIAKAVGDGVDHSIPKSSGGRNNKLVEIVSAMRIKGKPEDEIVRETYDYDKEKHDPRLFTDSNEGFKAANEADAMMNAWVFVSNVTRSLLKSGKIHPPSTSIEMEFVETNHESQLRELPMIPSDSMMSVFYRDIIDTAMFPQHKYAVAGALSLMSTLACGRFEFKGKTPITYSLVVGGTGIGKDQVRKFCYDVLTDERMASFNLNGVGNYTSVAGLVQDLRTQRSRLDILDEISSFLKECSFPNSYKRGVVLELTKLYTIGSGYYAGNRAYSRKPEEYGDCFSPMINMIGLCQPQTLISSVTVDMLDSGFLSRMLIFFEDKRTPLNIKAVKNSGSVEKSIDAILERFGKNKSIFGFFNTIGEYSIPMDISCNKPNSKQMTLSDSAFSLVVSLIEKYSKMSSEASRSDVERALLSRSSEQIERVAMILAISRNSCVIESKDIEWANELVDALIFNALSIIKQAAARSVHEKVSEEMVEFFKNRKQVGSRVVWSKFRHIESYKRTAMIKDLIDAGMISKSGSVYEYTGQNT
jgi:hypothetical protein